MKAAVVFKPALWVCARAQFFLRLSPWQCLAAVSSPPTAGGGVKFCAKNALQSEGDPR